MSEWQIGDAVIMAGILHMVIDADFGALPFRQVIDSLRQRLQSQLSPASKALARYSLTVSLLTEQALALARLEGPASCFSRRIS
jgi:hypothetical protein